MHMKKIFIPLGIFLVLIFIIIVLTGGNNDKTHTTSNTTTTTTPTTTNQTTPAKKDTVTVINTTASTDVIYFQTVTPSPGVPSKTTSDPNTPGVAIYWVNQGLVNSQDTCTLYSTATLQIYATRSLGSSALGVNPNTAYYTNNVITQDNTIRLLNNLCFK